MTDLQFLCDLVRRAGLIAHAGVAHLQSELKQDQSLVTNVDRAIETMLRREIAGRFPSDAFYGEEEGGDPLAADRVWIADPIDGTANMAGGMPSWGVSLGLSESGTPLMGAFYMPMLDDFYHFERGGGAWRNGLPLRVQAGAALVREDLVIIGSEAILAMDLSKFISRQRNLGSLACHWSYVAAGCARASVSVLEKLHDIGAVYGLASEAGCAIEYLDGGQAPFATFLSETTNYRPILVAHPDLLEALRASLSERAGWDGRSS